MFLQGYMDSTLYQICFFTATTSSSFSSMCTQTLYDTHVHIDNHLHIDGTVSISASA